MINDCSLIAKKNNSDFIWNSKFPINTLNIMRGYLFIDDKVIILTVIIFIFVRRLDASH